mmetsp:Transcript_18084/g.36407  ORF Transcript_18084/g.36407 Transcript_18084/m.36407 type:complete len:184 (-) Transcript_18084:18-569(-)
MKWMLVSTPPAVTMSFVGGRSHDHQLPPRSERHAVHEVGIARLAAVVDAISLDPGVGLDDPQHCIKDDGVGDDAIEGEGGGDGGHLATEFVFVAVVGEVGFDAEEEGGASEVESVAGGEAVGVGVGGGAVVQEGGVAEDDSVGSPPISGRSSERRDDSLLSSGMLVLLPSASSPRPALPTEGA